MLVKSTYGQEASGSELLSNYLYLNVMTLCTHPRVNSIYTIKIHLH